MFFYSTLLIQSLISATAGVRTPYSEILPKIPTAEHPETNGEINGENSDASNYFPIDGNAAFSHFLRTGTEPAPHVEPWIGPDYRQPVYETSVEPDLMTYNPQAQYPQAQLQPPETLQTSYMHALAEGPQSDAKMPNGLPPGKRRRKAAEYSTYDEGVAAMGQKAYDRLLRNRQAALDSRKRKKLHVEILETEKTDLEKQNTGLKSEVTGLQSEVTDLKAQVTQLIAANNEYERLFVTLMNERQLYLPASVPVLMPTGSAEGGFFTELSDQPIGFSHTARDDHGSPDLNMWPPYFDPKQPTEWDGNLFNEQLLTTAFENSPASWHERRSLYSRQNSIDLPTDHNNTEVVQNLVSIKRSPSDPASEFAYYMNVYSEIRTNVSILLFPYFATVLNQTNSSSIYDMVWSVYSDLVALGPYTIGPYSNGRTCFLWMQDQLFGNYTDYSENDKESAANIIAEYTVLAVIYRAVWGNATQIANATGYLAQMKTLRGYLNPASSSIMSDAWTKNITDPPAQYFTNLYNRSMFS